MSRLADITLAWILERCDLDEVYGCMRWRGPTASNGRPMLFTSDAPPQIVYRRALKLASGKPCPPDKVVGHRCSDELCCRPLHLEPVTKTENEWQKSMKYLLRRKTCPRGHAMTDYTRLLTPRGGLLCRTCAREDREELRP